MKNLSAILFIIAFMIVLSISCKKKLAGPAAGEYAHTG